MSETESSGEQKDSDLKQIQRKIEALKEENLKLLNIGADKLGNPKHRYYLYVNGQIDDLLREEDKWYKAHSKISKNNQGEIIR